MNDYRMSLVISFILKLKGDEQINGDELWACISFIIIDRGMHGVKWMSVGNDGRVKMASLYSIYSYVLFSWFR